MKIQNNFDWELVWLNRKMTYSKRIPSKSISKIQNAWENYIEKGEKSETLLRSEILLSWERSKKFGVNPFQKQVSRNVTSNELIDHQERNEKLLYYAEKNLKPLIPFLEDSETFIPPYS